MTDEQLESGSEVTESKAPPVPQISEPSGDERPSAAAVDTDALADQLTERVMSKLDEVIDRRLQSTKDKRFAALDGLDAEALKRFNQYVKKFGDENEAVRQMQIDTLINKASSGTGRQPVKTETRDTSVILAEVKADLGVEIAPDDPDLIKAANKSYSSWDSWRAEVLKLGARKAKQATVSPAAVVAETPQKAPSAGTVEAAQDKLNRLMAKGSPADVKAAMKELQEAMTRQR